LCSEFNARRTLDAVAGDADVYGGRGLPDDASVVRPWTRLSQLIRDHTVRPDRLARAARAARTEPATVRARLKELLAENRSRDVRGASAGCGQGGGQGRAGSGVQRRGPVTAAAGSARGDAPVTWRASDPAVFDATVLAAADELGVQPLPVEKDYWVCEALRALLATTPAQHDFAPTQQASDFAARPGENFPPIHTKWTTGRSWRIISSRRLRVPGG
jgi:hypothetical protein